MSPTVCHDSFRLECRKPFGAVPTGTALTLTLETEAAAWDACQLLLRGRGGEEEALAMEPGPRGFHCTFTAPEEPGLLWYAFRLAKGEEVWHYGRCYEELGGAGLLTRNLPPYYQITVYIPRSVPDWYKEGILYQIFPDRFHKAGEPGCYLGPKKDSLLHGSWEDSPFYQRRGDGSIRRWDFFGGNLAGIREKLPYLEELGVSVLYLNPIFQAASNHRYDTGDYHRIDPMLGTEEDFRALVEAAAGRGIRILLDGVFSHTGADSLYFNRYGSYGEGGAWQDPNSPYRSWFRFQEGGQEYSAWWGIRDLPEVHEDHPGYRSFIFEGEGSVLEHWMKAGAAGWRLDVADELPSSFIEGFREKMKSLDPESVLLGEVWEDASNKVSYGSLRPYFTRAELDGVMNYPLRSILLDFLLKRIPASMAARRLHTLWENYPRENFRSAMNLIGSHDQERILTLLGEAPPPHTLSEEDRGSFRLSWEARRRGLQRLKLMALYQLCLPGVPAIYYGDEAGMEGYGDPFNRGTFPWGREDQELLSWYRRLTALRREYDHWNQGELEPFAEGEDEDIFAFRIRKGEETLAVYGSRCPDRERVVRLSLEEDEEAFDLLGGGRVGWEYRGLAPLEGLLLLIRKKKPQLHKPKELGVLMPLASLPSPMGIGDLGEASRNWIDLLAKGGAAWWQLLPINPLGTGETPYQSSSLFAGSCLYLSLEDLAAEGLLRESDVKAARKELEASLLPPDRIDYELVRKVKLPLFHKAYLTFRRKVYYGRAQEGFLSRKAFEAFTEANAFWLEGYCLYKVLKKKDMGPFWLDIQDFSSRLSSRQRSGMDYHRFLQYAFFHQWQKMKEYGEARGVSLLGDLPIYVAQDSCATYTHPRYFRLDEEGQPLEAAGVPPDYFSPTGQLWGNPLYDWKAMEADGYAFFRERFRQAAGLYHMARMDHFRGYEAYWSVPAGALTAEGGRWHKGPGLRLFRAMEEEAPGFPILAEDLGVITPEVHNLRNILGYRGMLVWPFSQEEIREGMYEGENTVLYSGTHDTNTLAGWLEEQGRSPQDAGREAAAVLEELAASPAALVIFPVQDLLGLGGEGRINTPGTVWGNWAWRLKEKSKELEEKLQNLASIRKS